LRSGAALKGINHILQGTCVSVRDAGASSLIRHSGFVIRHLAPEVIIFRRTPEL